MYRDEDAELARCRNGGHKHRVPEAHLRLSPVVLPDGTQLTTASSDPAGPCSRVREPDYNLYPGRRWQPPWDHGYTDWPDFGVPADAQAAAKELKALPERARPGRHTETGCLGGHGRTGTALACQAVLAGHPATDAVAWVRSSYRPAAVETAGQEAFITAPSST